MSADRLPQFVIAGAPKAGTTALHAALATHPGLYLSPVKEPKYYLTGGRPPARSEQRGPGDAHSAREWVWRRDDYLGLFADAPPGTVRGESTPFYLYDRSAQERLVADVPHVKVIAVVRDPVDRAWSNWVHLRADGLEPEADFLQAVRLEERRVADDGDHLDAGDVLDQPVLRAPVVEVERRALPPHRVRRRVGEQPEVVVAAPHPLARAVRVARPPVPAAGRRPTAGEVVLRLLDRGEIQAGMGGQCRVQGRRPGLRCTADHELGQMVDGVGHDGVPLLSRCGCAH